MNRARFLKWMGLAGAAAYTGGKVSLPAAEAAAPVVAEAAPVPFNYYQLVARGGLCAPMAPFYDMPAFDRAAALPLRDALPSFTAERGR